MVNQYMYAMFLCPRFGRRRVASVSYFFYLLFPFLTAFSTNFVMFTTLRFFSGLFVLPTTTTFLILGKHRCFITLTSHEPPTRCLAGHDDVIKWKHFPRYWPFVRGIHRSPVNSPHKGQWRGALMFSVICVWINHWVTNREAGNLNRHHAHYDVTVVNWAILWLSHRTNPEGNNTANYESYA